jgi:hypothetical protein
VDVNQVITLGIGTPADIPHFMLVGLSPNANVVEVIAQTDLVGTYIRQASLAATFVPSDALVATSLRVSRLVGTVE